MSKNGNLVNWPGREWDVGAAGPLLRLAADLTEYDWRDEAACATVDPEMFFPEKGGSTYDARRVCRGCAVAEQCLEYALGRDERFGIYGGKTERERRKIKLERARRAAA